MKKEVSAGAVIYKIENDKIFYLIEYMGLGHISLVKGHQDKGETLIQTAIREIKEETSLDVDLDTSFKKTISYHPYLDDLSVIKDVTFFVAKVKDNNAIPIDLHDAEVVNSEFLVYNDAYNKLTHKSDKETLKEANEYIILKEGF